MLEASPSMKRNDKGSNIVGTQNIWVWEFSLGLEISEYEILLPLTSLNRHGLSHMQVQVRQVKCVYNKGSPHHASGPLLCCVDLVISFANMLQHGATCSFQPEFAHLLERHFYFIFKKHEIKWYLFFCRAQSIVLINQNHRQIYQTLQTQTSFIEFLSSTAKTIIRCALNNLGQNLYKRFFHFQDNCWINILFSGCDKESLSEKARWTYVPHKKRTV